MNKTQLMAKAIELHEKGVDYALATIVSVDGSAPRSDGASMIVLRDGSIEGTIGGGNLEHHVIGEAKKAIEKGESTFLDLALASEEIQMICGGAVKVYIEVQLASPRLILVGAGHVGKAIAYNAKNLDFELIAIDDREEFLQVEEFALAKKLSGDMPKLLSQAINSNSYVVIASRGHALDLECTLAAVEKNTKYLGLIGSRSKVLATRRKLEDLGIDKELIAKIYAPIGLDLGGQTPAAISISILAEILMIRYGMTGMHTRDKLLSNAEKDSSKRKSHCPA